MRQSHCSEGLPRMDAMCNPHSRGVANPKESNLMMDQIFPVWCCF